MKRFLYLQASLILLTVVGLGQNPIHYRGVVISNGEFLIGVQFMDVKSDKVIAISNELGDFDFYHSENQIAVSFLGYKSQIINSSSENMVIKLLEENSLLNAVVVIENKRETQLKDATVSLEIIKPSLIANTSPTNMEESIGRINGVQVVDNQPTIRSGSGWSYGAGSRVQVLVDGVPLLSGDAGQPLWTFVPTEGIAGVEIIKGASSVIYGSSALNGVINIKTKRPKSTPFTQVSLSGGFYDLPTRQSLRYQGNKRNTISNIAIYHTGTYKGIGVTIGLNALDDQGYKMGDYDKRVRANLGLMKVFGEKNLIVGVNSTYQKGTSGSFLLWESLDLGYTALDSGTTDNIVSRISIDPYLRWQKGKFKHSLNTRYLGVNNEVDNGDTANNQSNFSDLVYGEYQVQYSLPKKKFNATGGLVAISSITKSPLFSGEQKASNYAAYMQIDKKWNRLTASGGARYEYFKLNERTEGKPVFRAGLNYRLASYTYLRSSYGQGYRFPSIAESFITTSVGPITIFPNEILQSETGSNLELGIKQGLKIKDWQLMLDAAIFQMDYDNMMEFTFGVWNFTPPFDIEVGFKTLNTGKARVRGAEVNLGFQRKTKNLEVLGFVGFTTTKSKALQPHLLISTDSTGQKITYTSTSSDTADYALKYRPRNLIKGDVMVKYKKWHLGMGLAYQSQMQNIDLAFVDGIIAAIIPGIQESVNQKLTEYVLTNARIGYAFSSQWDSNLIVSNLTNREYAIRPADLGAPRSIRLQITYTLDKSK